MASILPFLYLFSNLGTGSTLPPIDASIEIVLFNGIKVFGDFNVVRQIADLVVEYLSI